MFHKMQVVPLILKNLLRSRDGRCFVRLVAQFVNKYLASCLWPAHKRPPLVPILSHTNYISYPPFLNAISILSSLLHIGYFRSFLSWLIFRPIRIVPKLPSLCSYDRLSVRLSACITAAAARGIFLKYGIGDFMEVCWETPNSLKTGTLRQELNTFYSWRRCYISLRMKRYRNITVAEEVIILRERVTVLHYRNIGLFWAFKWRDLNRTFICCVVHACKY